MNFGFAQTCPVPLSRSQQFVREELYKASSAAGKLRSRERFGRFLSNETFRTARIVAVSDANVIETRTPHLALALESHLKKRFRLKYVSRSPQRWWSQTFGNSSVRSLSL